MHGECFVQYLCTKQSKFCSSQSGLWVVFSRDRIKPMFNNTTVPWYSWSLLLRYPDQGISLAKKQQQETPKYKRLTDGFTQL